MTSTNCTITIDYLPTTVGIQEASLEVVLNSGIRTIVFRSTSFAKISASALDNSNLTWFSGGNASWVSGVKSGNIGGSAMRSGNITDNQSSVLFTYVTGPINLDFRILASTQERRDYLDIYVDEIYQGSISGLTLWRSVRIPLGEGEHTVAWIYQKDPAVSHHQDAVWLDNVNPDGTNTGNITRGGSSGGGSLGLLLPLFLLLPAARRFELV